MSLTQPFQVLKPCIAPGIHKFTAGLTNRIVCERCGKTPEQVRS